MNFTKIIKNKDTVQYLSVFLTIVLILVIQLFSSRAESQNITDAELTEILVSQCEEINNSSKVFFTLTPALNAIENSNSLEGLKNLVILAVESFVIYFVVCSVIAKMYIKAATAFSSMGSKKGKNVNLSKDIEKNKLWKTYLKKEFKILVRNPIFFMQCVLPSILFPLIFSIPIVVAIKDSDPDMMKIYTEFLEGDINTSVGFGLSSSLILMLFVFNFIAITAVSRDGKDSSFMKQIPVPLENQIFYKILPGIILNIIPIAYVIILEKILAPNINMTMIISLAITTMLVNIFNNYIMILIDLKNPKLNWTTEYAVVKQNFNMFFQFIIMAFQIRNSYCIMWNFSF